MVGEDHPDPMATAALARRLGPLRWSQLGRRPGALPTGAEADAVAAWMVDAADRWWHESGGPDPYTVVVVSADDGELARRVLFLGPECLRALRYVLVDPSRTDPEPGPPPHMAGRLALEEPAFLYPPGPASTDPDADPDEPAPPARQVGPLVTWLSDLPVPGDDPGAGLIVAVGELGCLPYDLFEWDGSRWCELRLAAGGDGADHLTEIRVPVAAPPAGTPGPAGGAAPGGGLLPAAPAPGRHVVAVGAVDWLRRTLATGPFGRLVVIDHWTAGAGPSGAAAPDAGTAHGALPVEQLARVREPLAGPEPVTAGWSAVTWRLG